MKPTALITGVTGQDGAYLTSYLLSKEYRVYGTYRPQSRLDPWRLHELDVIGHPDFELVEFDVADYEASIRLVEQCRPDEIYNFAAQSSVGASFSRPTETAKITGLGVLNLLEAVRLVNQKIKFYQSSSSEMFGNEAGEPRTEVSPFRPQSPYATSKLFAHWTTTNYREAYGLYAVAGILFNHESPLRGLEFVTRKITHAVSRIALGLQRHLELGSLDVKRDWGFAKDYVEGMYLMMQAPAPETYLLATGRAHSVREFVELAFRCADMEIGWKGSGIEEIGYGKDDQVLVRIDPRFFRPQEITHLVGDATKANNRLGWIPKASLNEICRAMVEADIKRNEALLKG